MRRWFVFLTVGVLSISSHAISSTLDTSNVRFMTFNIRYDNPDDGIYQWQNRRNLIFGSVRNHNPGVIGFQEVLVSQLRQLTDSLSYYKYYGVGRDDGKETGEFAPIFYLADRFSLQDSGVFWLSEHPQLPGSISWGAACTRITTWIKLKDIQSCSSFYIFNTHFDHISEEARVHAAALLLHQIDSIAGKSNGIVMGDFNCTSGDQSFELLAKDLILSGPSDEDIQDACTYIGFPPLFIPGNVIDFIFVTKGSRIKCIDCVISDYHQDASYPSDHLPVVCDMMMW
jgi:endonuclease/exonuclease/phosphatase family metal-dependent hydrolase